MNRVSIVSLFTSYVYGVSIDAPFLISDSGNKYPLSLGYLVEVYNFIEIFEEQAFNAINFLYFHFVFLLIFFSTCFSLELLSFSNCQSTSLDY